MDAKRDVAVHPLFLLSLERFTRVHARIASLLFICFHFYGFSQEINTQCSKETSQCFLNPNGRRTCKKQPSLAVWDKLQTIIFIRTNSTPSHPIVSFLIVKAFYFQPIWQSFVNDKLLKLYELMQLDPLTPSKVASHWLITVRGLVYKRSSTNEALDPAQTSEPRLVVKFCLSRTVRGFNVVWEHVAQSFPLRDSPYVHTSKRQRNDFYQATFELRFDHFYAN